MSKLTQDEKRVKIAEACGWTDIRFRGILKPKDKDYIGNHTSSVPEGATGVWSSQIPDYFNCLNSCHEAWKALTAIQHQQFKWHLVRVIKEVKDFDGPKASATCATAAQRAEAFGRTLNLWEAGQ